MAGNSLAKICLSTEINGKRPKGGPKLQWLGRLSGDFRTKPTTATNSAYDQNEQALLHNGAKPEEENWLDSIIMLHSVSNNPSLRKTMNTLTNIFRVPPPTLFLRRPEFHHRAIVV